MLQSSASDRISIRLERLLEAPPETVWRYLTKAELREQWFMGGTDAKPDGEFELLVDHDKLSDEEVPYPDSFECFKGRVFSERVLRFDPPRLLETTFQGGKGGKIRYELFPEGDNTRLVLTHSDITSPRGSRILAAAGPRTSQCFRRSSPAAGSKTSGHCIRNRRMLSKKRLRAEPCARCVSRLRHRWPSGAVQRRALPHSSH